ncbi:hypothetical protein DFS33DRAFT_1389096 [Desarmillaria ectypa]|nr:hypothetical protein DFS33DRAFT_1389096 [Desarmillaria ectypa]
MAQSSRKSRAREARNCVTLLLGKVPPCRAGHSRNDTTPALFSCKPSSSADFTFLPSPLAPLVHPATGIGSFWRHAAFRGEWVMTIPTWSCTLVFRDYDRHEFSVTQFIIISYQGFHCEVGVPLMVTSVLPDERRYNRGGIAAGCGIGERRRLFRRLEVFHAYPSLQLQVTFIYGKSSCRKIFVSSRGDYYVKSLQERITQTYEELEGLLAEQTRVTECAKSLLIPIRRLDAGSNPSLDSPNLRSVPWTLSHVCTRWKHMAFSNTKLVMLTTTSVAVWARYFVSAYFWMQVLIVSMDATTDISHAVLHIALSTWKRLVLSLPYRSFHISEDRLGISRTCVTSKPYPGLSEGAGAKDARIGAVEQGRHHRAIPHQPGKGNHFSTCEAFDCGSGGGGVELAEEAWQGFSWLYSQPYFVSGALCINDAADQVPRTIPEAIVLPVFTGRSAPMLTQLWIDVRMPSLRGSHVKGILKWTPRLAFLGVSTKFPASSLLAGLTRRKGEVDEAGPNLQTVYLRKCRMVFEDCHSVIVKMLESRRKFGREPLQDHALFEVVHMPLPLRFVEGDLSRRWHTLIDEIGRGLSA